MPKLIIGLTGQLGSGKGYVASYLATRYGGIIVKFSSYLSKVLDVMALDNSRDNLIKLSEAMRREYGEQALSYAVARDAVSSEAPVVVIDGIRRVEDLAALEPLPHFVLIAVAASPEIRYGRITKRGEKTDETDLTWEEFQAQERRSTELTVPTVMKRATIHIKNEGTVAELEEKIDEMTTQLDVT
ncbi:MAG TPA: AAA family ATPase [Candidatus Methylomirabilis sp.]|nr:AAA family ATPase [Candidatus Methylomirabilis sp.]